MIDARALAEEYQLGLEKMEAAGYEEFGPQIERHKIVIAALRAVPSPPVNVGREEAANWIVEKIIKDIIRPGWGPEERTCYELAGQLRAAIPGLSLPAIPSGGVLREALVATALARRLCQLFDGGGESQRSVRARHASAIFQLLSKAFPASQREQRQCDANPVGYLEYAERAALTSTLPVSREK